MVDASKVLHAIGVLVDREDEDPQATLRALDCSLSLVAARRSVPEAIRWYLKHQVDHDDPDTVLACRVRPKGAAQLEALIERVLVLYADSRHCNLVGNSGAGWTYSTFALLAQRPDTETAQRTLQHLIDLILAEPDKSPAALSFRAVDAAPANTLLLIKYAFENPDSRSGHSMMHLELNGNDAINYWPALDAEFNQFDLGALRMGLNELGLTDIEPLQLAAFLAVIAEANPREPDSWGGKRGLFPFEEGNIPYVMTKFGMQ